MCGGGGGGGGGGDGFRCAKAGKGSSKIPYVCMYCPPPPPLLLTWQLNNLLFEGSSITGALAIINVLFNVSHTLWEPPGKGVGQLCRRGRGFILSDDLLEEIDEIPYPPSQPLMKSFAHVYSLM